MPLVNTMVSFMRRWTRPPEVPGPDPARHPPKRFARLRPGFALRPPVQAGMVWAAPALLLVGLCFTSTTQALPAAPAATLAPTLTAAAAQQGDGAQAAPSPPQTQTAPPAPADPTAKPEANKGPAPRPLDKGKLGESSAVRQHQWQLQRSDQALLLSARLAVSLSPSIEDALTKGLPLFFVWQADVLRERWYWRDQRIASSNRTLRLAYQPLTRRWRVSLHEADGPVAANALQYALHQNHDTLAEALAGVTRVANWRLGPAPADADQLRIELRFKLDLTLLPRPWQIGMANQGDWAIDERLFIPVDAALANAKPSPVKPSPAEQ